MSVSRAAIPLFFGQDALAASQTNTQLPCVMAEASSVVDGFPMMWEYDIVGLDIRVSAAPTVGTLTANPTIGGVAVADSDVVIGVGETQDSKAWRRNRYRGASDGVLGVEIDTSADWDGTAADLLAVLWVLPRLQRV